MLVISTGKTDKSIFLNNKLIEELQKNPIEGDYYYHIDRTLMPFKLTYNPDRSIQELSSWKYEKKESKTVGASAIIYPRSLETVITRGGHFIHHGFMHLDIINVDRFNDSGVYAMSEAQQMYENFCYSEGIDPFEILPMFD